MAASVITSVTVTIVREVTKRHEILKKIIFHFQVFQTFGKLEIGFRANLNKCFCEVINTSEVTLLFSQNSDAL